MHNNKIFNLPEGYNLRLASNADSGEIRKLVFGILNEYGLSPDPCDTDRDLEDIESNYNNNSGMFSVLTDETNKIVASTGIIKLSPDECELRKMYLDKNQRGKGLGKFLLEYSLDFARSAGYKKVVLESASVLKEALGLYTSHGFVEYTGDHISCRCDKRFFLNL